MKLLPLTAGDGRGRFVSARRAVFQGERLAIQRLDDDRRFLRRHRAGDVAISVLFAVLLTVDAAAAAGGHR